MLRAVCAVCKETVRVASEKLVTVQWVDQQTNGLCSLHFHTDCYFRWYQQTAAEVQKRLSTSQPEPPPGPPALPAPREGQAVGVAGDFLTEEEKRALLRLRRKLRSRRATADGLGPTGPEAIHPGESPRGGAPEGESLSQPGSPETPPESPPAPEEGDGDREAGAD